MLVVGPLDESQGPSQMGHGPLLVYEPALIIAIWSNLDPCGYMGRPLFVRYSELCAKKI